MSCHCRRRLLFRVSYNSAPSDPSIHSCVVCRVSCRRGYAASGIGLSILFQFYRPQPLWIPIGWNGLFLLINASMIGLLLREKSEAANIGDDPEQVTFCVALLWRIVSGPHNFVTWHHTAVAGPMKMVDESLPFHPPTR